MLSVSKENLDFRSKIEKHLPYTFLLFFLFFIFLIFLFLHFFGRLEASWGQLGTAPSFQQAALASLEVPASGFPEAPTGRDYLPSYAGMVGPSPWQKKRKTTLTRK